MASRTRSGQATVAAAGTAVQLTTANNEEILVAVVIKSLVSNAGLVYVGNDGAGDVTSANGFELSPGDSIPFEYRNPKTGEGSESTANIWVDAAANGYKVSWIGIRGVR
jgi:hypothetical protein